MSERGIDRYDVVLWNVHMRSVDRVVDSFAGPGGRADAIDLATTLDRLREQLTMLGVTFSAAYAVRVQQIRRDRTAGLYGAQRKRFLGADQLAAAEEDDASFWADDIEESVQRTITDGAERVERAAETGAGATL